MVTITVYVPCDTTARSLGADKVAQRIERAAAARSDGLLLPATALGTPFAVYLAYEQRTQAPLPSLTTHWTGMRLTTLSLVEIQ